MPGWQQVTEPQSDSPHVEDTMRVAAATSADANGGHDGAAPAWASNGAGDGHEGELHAAVEATPDMTKEELNKKARAQGWTEAIAFDYEEFKRLGGNDGDFHGAAKVYEWKDQYGDVGPEIPELEQALFGGEFQMRRGEHFEALAENDAQIDGPDNTRVRKFEDAGLHPVVLRNIELAQYGAPTPIQQYAIPAILNGHDVLAIAQTGSGKTAAYMIPIISKLMGKAKKLAGPRPDTSRPDYDARLHKTRAEPLVVITVPTRELAIQIFDEARRMCYRSMLRPCVAYGGLPMKTMFDQLGAGCDILIATPGRLCDLMDKPGVLTLNRVKFTVIDEADEMLDDDWAEELGKIMNGGDSNENADHVYIMTSATFPKGVRKLANEYLAKDFCRIRIGQTASAHKNIRQNVLWVDSDRKQQAVYDLLFEGEPVRTMIFCNSKMTVDKLDDFLYNRCLPTTSIHADRNQREREDAMRAFRTGKCPILIATGISARGWDVKDCKHVINYDLPSAMHGGITEYIHRIGRTARIGHQGLATSFYNERDDELAQALVNVLIDCKCDVPEFLQQYVPEGGQVNFQDDTDEEDEAEAAYGTTGEGFGDSGDGAEATGWGADAEGDTGGTKAGGFAADNGFSAAEGGAVAAGGW